MTVYHETTTQSPSLNRSFTGESVNLARLGNTYEICVHNSATSGNTQITNNRAYGRVIDKSPVKLRFDLQNAAKELLPTERVSGCLRRIAPVFDDVRVMHTEGTTKARYKNLMVCGSVWTCPVCAATITERRRQELTKAISQSDLHPILVTITLQHTKDDSLDALLDALLDSYRRLKSGRWWQKLQAKFGIAGSIRGLEDTRGEVNGWHPHAHVLMLLEDKPDEDTLEALEDALKARWTYILAKFHGRFASLEHGLTITDDNKNVREYVAKFGRMPKETSWTVEHELTKAPAKKGRIGGRTPFQLLHDYKHKGDRKAGKLFQEHARAMKGRKQLVWSRGLRERLGLAKTEAEAEAAEAAEAAAEAERELLRLSRFEWRQVVMQSKRAELLLVAATGDRDKLLDYLDSVLDQGEGGEADRGGRIEQADRGGRIEQADRGGRIEQADRGGRAWWADSIPAVIGWQRRE
jgi:hypothetical protein